MTVRSLKKPSVRVGVDIGGTFTDIVLSTIDGQVAFAKVPSTAEDYGRAIAAGVVELIESKEIHPRAIVEIVHGTTIATNAILERTGVPTAFVTTEGFRDLLEMRRIRIPELYNLAYEKLPPLVPRRWCLEVEERIGADGRVRRPLERSSVQEAIARLAQLPVDAVAICLLHSYCNPAHEHLLAAAIRRELPRLYVTTSADLVPEIREYERASSTVINSYIGPIVTPYLASLTELLRDIGIDARLLIMQSSGGVITPASACQRPAWLIESGPAAGVKASSFFARAIGVTDVITFDMGGTTAKASLIEGGVVTFTSDYEVGGGINMRSKMVAGGGYPLKLPAIEVAEVGAGGGSIAWIDRHGRLRLGPQSAGAMPGPACYDAGGTRATLTDANLVLGYLNPSSLVRGRVTLNAEMANDALDADVATPLGMELLDAAYGVHILACESMIRAVKAVSTYAGRDPRDFAFLAFGGNGPLHAASMARMLEMRRIIVPPIAGVFSAAGLLFSDLEHQAVRTLMLAATESAASTIATTLTEMEHEAGELLTMDGSDDTDPIVVRFADMRYEDQGYELTVPIVDGPFDGASIHALVEAFEEAHLKAYGHRAADEVVDIVSLRVAAVVRLSRPDFSGGNTPFAELENCAPEVPAARLAYFGPEFGVIEAPVLKSRTALSSPRRGPFIIDEVDTTCVVPPDFAARLDRSSALVLEVGC